MTDHLRELRLKLQKQVESEWKQRFLSSEYDSSNRPVEEKRGATLGMAMTEKQGGSDVRANTTEAHPVSSAYSGLEYELVGHKWFCSAPMSDAFLTLAQTGRGLTCFLMPRWRPDGSKNPVLIQRLKDKMGNRSNASAEIEMRGAWAQRVGAEGRGVANIIKMVALTRFDCMVGSAALMRQALLQACHHARYRRVFGRKMLDKELMQNVLADLVIESEAALWFSMRMAHSLDCARQKPESLFLRIGVAVGKYALCKTAQFAVAEGQECLGGGGYIEESVLPRLYREAPVNSIWEGSGNVQCLDVMRALKKDPETADALLSEIEMARGEDKQLDRMHDELRNDMAKGEFPEFHAREVVGRMATALQAALLIRFGHHDSSKAFCASRLHGPSSRFFGNLPQGTPCKAIIERACPDMC